MSLRIAYMTGQYPRATDTFIQREVSALRAHDVHVETLSVRKPAEKEFVGPEQCVERDRTYYLLPVRVWELFKAHLGLLFGSPGRYARALLDAVRVRPPGLRALLWQGAYFLEAGLVAQRMRSHQLAHLHNHFSNSSCSVAMLAAMLGGFSFSFTMHGPSEFFEPHYWRIDEKIRRARFVCCISNFCRSQAMIFAPTDAWNRMHVVHCGVDAGQFQPRWHRGRGNRVLFVGRLAPVKGLAVLIEAVKVLRERFTDVELTIAGDGPDRTLLQQAVERAGICDSVRFLGYQSQSQVRQLLRDTDVFAMSSFAEGVPVVLMEAMAAGIPCVAPRIAGIPELIENGVSGLLVPPADSLALADKIGRLLDDPNLRNRLAQAGRQKVQAEFDIDAEAQWLVQILTGALRGELLPVRRPQPTNTVATEESLAGMEA